MLDTHHVNSDIVGVDMELGGGASLDPGEDPSNYLDTDTQAKYEHLQAILRAMESVLVAYSGGVDSALLLKVAFDVLGDRALGVIASSPAYADEETGEAIAVAEEMGIPLITLQT